MISKKQLFILTVIVLGISFVLVKMEYGTDEDSRITELKKEALELQIYEKTRYLRKNAEELFGWEWRSAWRGSVFVKNGVSFSGKNGEYEIGYKDIFIEWKDRKCLIIYYEGFRVYEIYIGREFVFKHNRVKMIRAYRRGEWLDVFNEMFVQAIKSIPEVEADELMENWGLN